jgi:hypothetical protein
LFKFILIVVLVVNKPRPARIRDFLGNAPLSANFILYPPLTYDSIIAHAHHSGKTKRIKRVPKIALLAVFIPVRRLMQAKNHAMIIAMQAKEKRRA